MSGKLAIYGWAPVIDTQTLPWPTQDRKSKFYPSMTALSTNKIEQPLLYML